MDAKDGNAPPKNTRRAGSGPSAPADAAPSKSRRAGARKKKESSVSQLMELFLHVAELLGLGADKDVAELAGASVENVSNWRSGAVQEFKSQKLQTIKARLAAHIGALAEQAGAVDAHAELGLSPLEVEDGSGPADLQRQFRDRVAYDYLGHRFLYYEPMGALAWENLIKRGYDQDRWIAGIERCATQWLDTTRDAHGRAKGPLAELINLGRRGHTSGLDLVSLGPGEGEKEVVLLKSLLAAESAHDQHLAWLAYVPVDVSIPLLLVAARAARNTMVAQSGGSHRASCRVRPVCADFEEGQLAFIDRLPTSLHSDRTGARLILMLGNTFGNLRDEEAFVRHRLYRLARRGDLVWLEIGLRLDPLERDPLFRMTQSDAEITAGEANRRLLLEGPYRRWEAATGRPLADLQMRIWVREDDDSCRVPGSVNFCHDLVMKSERRVCTMLYSRRYVLEDTTAWFEKLGFTVLRLQRIEDSKNQARVAHLLLRRD